MTLVRWSLARRAVGLALALGAGAGVLSAQGKSSQDRDDSRATFSLAKQGYFYVNGKYDNPAAPTVMSQQMYVEYQIPTRLRRGAYPVIFVHGGGHTGAGWQSTPDGRPGWADYFLARGYPTYVVDQPGRAKSPWSPPYGTSVRNPAQVRQAEDLWSASEKAAPAVQWPQANLHTQWPGTGTRGDPIFDQYFAHLAPGIGNGALQEELTESALVALLEKLGPSIVVIHSQPGTALWVMADRRPDLVKALVAVEPSGPPIYNTIVRNPPFAGPPVARPWGPSINRLTYMPAAHHPSQLSIYQEAHPDGPGLTACWLQTEPARQLPRLQGLKILQILAPASYHAPYDHCTVKWLRQAGVMLDFVKLEDIGIFGNGHLLAIEKNSDEIAGVVQDWLRSNVSGKGVRLKDLIGARKGSAGDLEIAKQGVFFVGGVYNDAATSMSGQMFVRYQIPARLKKGAYPIVMVHGGGQQNTTFSGTPDNRSGWADYLLKRGYAVYNVDQPGRGKSPYNDPVYGPYGTLNIANLENLFTATARAMLWPQAALHTQWPGSGLHGDPTFDQFIAQQYQGMGALLQEQYTSKALIALLDRIGPAILLTHSQSGPHGWVAADARPNLVKGIIAVEPNGPPFYEVSLVGAPTWFSYGGLGRAYGITRLPLTFSPAMHNPTQLAPVQQQQADGPDMVRCYLQSAPARKLTQLAKVPVVIVTGEASFRATYDHCTSKFLTQAGVKNAHVRLEDFGIHGNGHMMMLEKNNLAIAKLLTKVIENGMRVPRDKDD
jgi:pimeloyl-ACP methyl ester carboxylesterase